MIIYAAIKGNIIIEKQIIREDAQSVYFRNSKGGEREESKQGAFCSYFSEWEYAKDFLWINAIKRASKARTRLKESEKRLRVENLKDTKKLNKLKTSKCNVEKQIKSLSENSNKDIGGRNLAKVGRYLSKIKRNEEWNKKTLLNIEFKIVNELSRNIYKEQLKFVIEIRKRIYFVKEVESELKRIKNMFKY